jgi:hypothetical protein
MAEELKCAKCSMTFWLPDEFATTMRQLAEKGEFFCPAGHGQYFPRGKTDLQKAREEADALRRRAERAEQQYAELNDAARASLRSAAAYKGAATRKKNRAKAGVCPCCNRTFQDLQRHMATKHTDAKLNNVVEFEPKV